MTRTLPFAAALASAAALLTAVAVPAEAQSGAHYVAKPVAAARPSVITRSTPWTLSNGVYVANRAPERDVVLCQLLAKNVGPLESFSAGGAPLDADALAKCNSRAKGGVATGMAAAAAAPAGGR